MVLYVYLYPEELIGALHAYTAGAVLYSSFLLYDTFLELFLTLILELILATVLMSCLYVSTP